MHYDRFEHFEINITGVSRIERRKDVVAELRETWGTYPSAGWYHGDGFRIRPVNPGADPDAIRIIVDSYDGARVNMGMTDCYIGHRVKNFDWRPDRLEDVDYIKLYPADDRRGDVVVAVLYPDDDKEDSDFSQWVVQRPMPDDFGGYTECLIAGKLVEKGAMRV